MRLWFLACTSARGLQGTNLKKLLRTVQALADLGPELTADRDFRQTARTILTAVMEAAAAPGAAPLSFGERPAFATSASTLVIAQLPRPSAHPHAPRHRFTPSAA